MDRLLRAIDGLSEYSGRIFSVTVLIATVVVIFEVVMRYVFVSPTAWGFELPIILAGASYLLSGAYAEKHEAHIRVDLLYARMPPRGRALVDVLLTAPVFLGSLAVIAWYGLDWTLAAYEADTRTGTAWNPVVWPMRSLIPVGAVLLLLQGIAGLLRSLRILAGGDPGAAAAENAEGPQGDPQTDDQGRANTEEQS